MNKLQRYVVPILLLATGIANGASLEWTGEAGTPDFFDETNWVIMDGQIGNSGPGMNPPSGTIDPFVAGVAPIMHDLFVMNAGTVDFSNGDIGLQSELGSLMIDGDSSVVSDADQAMSVASVGGFGALLEMAGDALLEANGLIGVDLNVADRSTVRLFDDVDPLPDDTMVTFTSTMPSPCLVLGGISPGDAQTMYGSQIGTNDGGMIDYNEGNPFGTIIKAANMPEPAANLTALMGLAGLAMMRRRRS